MKKPKKLKYVLFRLLSPSQRISALNIIGEIENISAVIIAWNRVVRGYIDYKYRIYIPNPENGEVVIKLKKPPDKSGGS